MERDAATRGEVRQPPELEPGTIESFAAEGAAVLRGVFADWVETLRAGIERNMASPSWRERTYEPADGSARFFQDYAGWARIPEYRSFLEESTIASLAAALMRSRTARLFHEHVLVKEAGTSIVTPWHHDQPYYCVEGLQNVSFWVPLDPVAEEVTIRYVAGSHRWGKLFRPQRFDGSKLYDGDESEPVPDIDAEPERYRLLSWPVEPGDAVAFDFRTLHSAPANRSNRRRRVISFRFVGDDAVYTERPGKVCSPPFPDLTLRPGEPLAGPDFPLLYGGQ